MDIRCTARWGVILPLLFAGCQAQPDVRLYSDREILDQIEMQARDLVPPGTKMPRRTAFDLLGLDESRLPTPWRAGAMGWMHLYWQVSSSFDLECLAPNELDLDLSVAAGDAYYFDPRREVCGLLIHQHHPKPGCERD